MHTLTRIGRVIFATGIIALGFLSIVVKDFIIGRPPAGTTGFNNPALVYFSAAAVIIAALLMSSSEKNQGGCIRYCAADRGIFYIRHALSGFADWLNTYKALALAGGALIIGSSFSVILQKIFLSGQVVYYWLFFYCRRICAF
jgi:hypothetical protein